MPDSEVHGSEFTKQGAEIALAHHNELEALKVEFMDEANELRDELTDRKAEVENLVGVIGNLGVTSGYLNAQILQRQPLWFGRAQQWLP